MPTFLFDEIIFGPVFSRRLGRSLGVNLLPLNKKLCNFNCIYCECGLTPYPGKFGKVPSKDEVVRHLRHKLQQIAGWKEKIDVITFAGNGEPTLHPAFPEIMDKTLALRNEFLPDVQVAVLSNATTLGKSGVFESLRKVDKPVLKLDSAFEDTINQLNCPNFDYRMEEVIRFLKRFDGQFILQTLFLRGTHNGKLIDNASDDELTAWLRLVKELNPREVMIYTIARDTPYATLDKIPEDELYRIARLVEDLGIKASVSG